MNSCYGFQPTATYFRSKSLRSHSLHCLPEFVIQTQRLEKLLILVTAFTLGHSLTLALSVFDLVTIPASWIEIAIALTIAVTCLINFRSWPLIRPAFRPGIGPLCCLVVFMDWDFRFC